MRPAAASVKRSPPSVSARQLDRRRLLQRLLRYFGLIIAAAVVYVMLDFAVDIRPPGIHSSYRFDIDELALDEVRILRQDNLSIVVIRRSAETVRALEQGSEGLQDPDSSYSHQPDYAQNPLRSRHADYFVGYAIGTNLGCAPGLVPSCAEGGVLGVLPEDADVPCARQRNFRI